MSIKFGSRSRKPSVLDAPQPNPAPKLSATLPEFPPLLGSQLEGGVAASFPRHTFGIADRLEPVDTGWDHRDKPVVDLTEPRRRYDAGWVI